MVTKTWSSSCHAITCREVWMIANFDGGKERSPEEYGALAKTIGTRESGCSAAQKHHKTKAEVEPGREAASASLR
ncbi:hypothetical protein ACLOJK_009564 [Asimina triloba]